MIVPAPPGGSLDTIARPVAQGLSDAFGQQVVMDNRPGAAGVIGSDLVAKATPDGYTLLMTNLAFAITATLLPKMPYDPVKDFVAVAQLTRLPYLVVVTAGLPAQSLRELIELARAKPDTLVYGSLGNGSGSHLTTEILRDIAGIRMVHVPYKGFGPLMPDLLSGRVHVALNTIPSLLPHVRSGRLRALAITADTRSRLLPEVPTAAEAGLPRFRVTTWHGMFAPAHTPGPIVSRLHASLEALLKDRNTQERLAADGAEPVGSTPEEFGRFLRDEMARWGAVVRATKASVD
jgi:tripartite-type tricarboxylate transporter receptor subunit TctC